ncbi:MAG TPA: cysteine--tRNA ligase [Spirochaetota bacterium]|nr:cysteine--tRNA ligase [Spirochaetota bacterium]
MALKIFNTLTRRLEPFIPGGVPKENIEDYPPVTIYSCGPTVYSYAHIGNFRTFVFNDFLRRYLKFRGFKVNHAMNITDVDDKTIAGALNDGITLREYTDKYTNIFFEDLRTLNIEPVEHYPRATESIDAMIDIIAHLDKKGLIYEKDGSIYFSIAKFHRYGRLSNVTSMDIKAGARYDADEYSKEDVRDFALWKAPKENEPYWDTPFGKGRPGWHIECSAMVRKIFGTTIDIHTGGVDLIFPHHENEIAQSEAAYDEPFVRYWIHVEHLLVEGSKMSKSLGNFYTLRDLLDKGYSPRAIRYLLLTAHYRKQLNFTFDGLNQAAQALLRIDNLLARLNDIKHDALPNQKVTNRCNAFITAFTETVDDDLNIAGGTGIFFDFIHDINTMIDSNSLSKSDAMYVMDVLKKIDTVFGFIFFPEVLHLNKEEIEALIEERNKARKEKNFAKADAIRDELLQKGIILQDTKEGTRWIRKS